MRMSAGPVFGLVLVAAVLVATAFDLAVVAAHALKPWLGWMLP